jgi:hypothetical protein
VPSCPSGIISPRTFLFRKELPRCLAESSSNDTAVELVIIIVLAVAALILAGILSVVIVKERKGSPLFMPLLPKNDESSQQTSSI